MNDPIGLVMVITTVSSSQDAELLAAALVDHALAACVQIDGPVTSLYRWAGKVEKNSEYRLLIKTSETAWPALKRKLSSLHPYDEPEIILFSVSDASDGYRAWVIDQTM